MKVKARPILKSKKNRLLRAARLAEQKARRRQRIYVPKPIQRLTQWRGG